MSLVIRKTQTVNFYRLATVFFRAQRAYSACFHTKEGEVYMNRKSYENQYGYPTQNNISIDSNKQGEPINNQVSLAYC